MSKQPKPKPTDPANILPTPAVGEPLVWYPRAEENSGARACVCAEVEGPGRIKVAIFSPNQPLQYKSGVVHMSSTRHVLRPAESVNSGGWDYPSVPSDPYQFHRDFMERQTLAKLENEQRAEEARKAREEQVKRAVSERELVS